MYALKLPNGKLVAQTFSLSKSECWGTSFDVVGNIEGQEWTNRFWKSWRRSQISARKLGYKIVKVRLVEEKKRI